MRYQVLTAASVKVLAASIIRAIRILRVETTSTSETSENLTRLHGAATQGRPSSYGWKSSNTVDQEGPFPLTLSTAGKGGLGKSRKRPCLCAGLLTSGQVNEWQNAIIRRECELINDNE
jgi:hypothetical protein